MKTDKIKEWIKKSPLLALGLSMAVVIVVIAAIVAGLVSAMYKQERQVVSAPTQITVSADLADTLEVWEHEAYRTDLGDYKLMTGEEDVEESLVHGNNYTLMPGVDIPKDTFVRVTGKTEIDAYLYIEVKSTVNDPAVTFEVDSAGWTALTDGENAVTGPGGGKVYVYRNGTKLNLANFSGEQKIAVLTDDEVKVGQALDHSSTADSSVLTVYAYMAQALNLNAYDAFTTAFPQS